MNKISCIVIDDEKLGRDVVLEYLKAHINIEVIQECKNGFEGIKAIQDLKPDLIFLDIQMPKINGFEMLELLDEPPTIIFTTAFDQYALKAFEVNAIDYLLKPFSKDRFAEAVERAEKNINNKIESSKNIEKLKTHVAENLEYLNRIIIKEKSRIKILPVEEVEILEALDDYVQIVWKGEKLLKQKTMKYYETHLDPKLFLRIHRSYIVNINQIKNIELLEKDTHHALLHNGLKLPISKTGYSKVKELLNMG
ncbi:MAG: DNA-binding response regulator [Ignavibacteriae bacterium HGW-Ignavibacteriae-2]|jgi:two-component system LytT family response regulator|nr:LytTR family transcriptional regulator DNA-binding domain-containing protein [Bacteroidota bacterium]PKL90291.1 MAG: DNA-binding response regulator [Ignavibacteriae bacterium HGW-Ignavibacteriae-2]